MSGKVGGGQRGDGDRQAAGEAQPAEPAAGGRRVVKVSMAQAAAAGQPAATARVVPAVRPGGTAFGSRRTKRAAAPVTLAATPLRLPRTDAQLLALGGLGSPACASRLERAVRAVPGVEEVQASPGAGLLAVAPGSVDGAAVRAAVEAAGHKILGTGPGGPAGPTRPLLSAASVLGVGVLAVVLRHGFGLVEAAAAASLAGLLVAGPALLPVLRHLRRGHLVGELLPVAASLLLLVGGVLSREAIPVELAPFPLATHLAGLGLAAAIRQRHAATVARLRVALPSAPDATVALGGHVAVRPGAQLPSDGTLVASAVIDERLLGGGDPAVKLAGEQVCAGSVAPEGCELALAPARRAPSRPRSQRSAAVSDSPAEGAGRGASAASRQGPEPREHGAPPERLRIGRALAIAERALATRLEPGLADLASRALPFVAAGAALAAGIDSGLPAAAATLAAAAPLALGLAPALAIGAGLARAVAAGAVPRSGAALLRAGAIRTVLLDRDGVLLRGAGGVVELVVRQGQDALELLALAAAASEAAPISPGSARALAIHAARLCEQLPELSIQAEQHGVGLLARSSGRELLLGTLPWLTAHGISAGPLAGAAEELARRGHGSLWLALDGAAEAVLGIGDVPRDGARRAVGALELLGIRVLVASGDATSAVHWLAEDLGLDRDAGRGDLGTEGRLALVREARAAGPVAVVASGPPWEEALGDAELGVSFPPEPEVERLAGVVLLRADLAAVPVLLAAGQAARAARFLAFFCAALGNATGLLLAATGGVGPLGAAALALATTVASLTAAATASGRR